MQCGLQRPLAPAVASVPRGRACLAEPVVQPLNSREDVVEHFVRVQPNVQAEQPECEPREHPVRCSLKLDVHGRRPALRLPRGPDGAAGYPFAFSESALRSIRLFAFSDVGPTAYISELVRKGPEVFCEHAGMALAERAGVEPSKGCRVVRSDTL